MRAAVCRLLVSTALPAEAPEHGHTPAQVELVRSLLEPAMEGISCHAADLDKRSPACCVCSKLWSTAQPSLRATFLFF